MNNMKYLYESHMGGIYTDEDFLDFDDLYCETCGDSDYCMGSFNTLREFWELIRDECSINESGGICLDSVYPIIVEEFNLPYEVTYENSYAKDCGFCSNSEKEILDNIEDAIVQEVKKEFHDYIKHREDSDWFEEEL